MKRTTRTVFASALALLACNTFARDIPLSDPTVASLASDLNTSREQARRRLVLQGLASDLQEELKAKHPDILGGVYLVHSPDFRMNILLTNGGMEEIYPLLTGSLNALRPYISVIRARWTNAELEEKMRTAIAIVRDAGETAEFDVDLVHNGITINSIDPAGLASAIAVHGSSLPEGATILQVGTNTRPLAYAPGGVSIRECTSGFGVIDPNSRRGIITAAHCGNNSQYYPDYSSNLLPYISGTYGIDWDVEWHSVPGYTPTNQIWNGSNYIYITGLKYRGSMVVGEYICKNGRMTGAACGYIRSTSFTPTSIPSASSKWATLGGPSIYGEGGDSGGPVWSVDTAYGIIHGIYYDYSAAEYRLVFMPADGVYSGTGAYILVSP